MTAPAPSVDISKNKTIRLRTAPAWLPEKYRKRFERIRISFKPTIGERRFFRRRKIVPPSVCVKCRTCYAWINVRMYDITNHVDIKTWEIFEREAHKATGPGGQC